MICTTLNDLCCVEWYVLPWMICTTLSGLYNVEWFELRCMICTALNYLYSVELFVVQRWIICDTLNDLYYVEWFVQRWMIFYFLVKFVRPRLICTALKNLYYVEWFRVRWMICTMLNHLGYGEVLSIGFLMMPGVLIRKNTVRYLTLNSELIFSWFGNNKKKYFRLCPRNWS